MKERGVEGAEKAAVSTCCHYLWCGLGSPHLAIQYISADERPYRDIRDAIGEYIRNSGSATLEQ